MSPCPQHGTPIQYPISLFVSGMPILLALPIINPILPTGTMNREASILQTPVISCYPGETLSVDQYYINKGLMYRSNDSDEVIEQALNFIVNPQEKIDVKTDDLFQIIINNVYDLARNGK